MLLFEEVILRSDRRKTKIWSVVNPVIDAYLGEIKWNNKRRKYAFYPYKNTLFASDCLMEIAEFCDKSSKEHKSTWPKRD